MSEETVKSITPADLHQLIQDDPEIELIDVRPRKMYEIQRVEQARFIDYTTLDPQEFMASRASAESPPVYIICQLGIRSVEACEQFNAAGFDNIINIEGGTKAWAKAGLPTIGEGKGIIGKILSLFGK